MSGCDSCFCEEDDEEANFVVIPEKRNLETKQEIVEDNFSFFFVREPYRRLFSTYSNKFYLPKENWEPIGPAIAKRYRLSPSKESLKFGHDVTFKELVQYTVDEFEEGRLLDVHLRPMYQFCDPCRFNYTFIGKLETLDYDWDIMTNIWRDEELSETIVTSSEQKDTTMNSLPEVRHCFRVMAKIEGSSISPHSILLRCWDYFKINGRIANNISMPFDASDAPDVGFTEFHNKVSRAIDMSSRFGKVVSRQKDDALRHAYSTIPRSLLERLRKVVLADCQLFGYEDRPSWLFGHQ